MAGVSVEERRASEPEEIGRLIDQVLTSDPFRSAPNMRTLLQYLWQHRGQSISEYAIALDALGRPQDFDPRADATVRVQIARLRAKLREFYEGEGTEFPLRLAIPVGCHDLKWEFNSPPQAPPPQKGFTIQPLYRGVLLGIAATLVIAAAVFMVFQGRLLQKSVAAPPLPLARFWQSFLAGVKSTAVVIPSPTYFQWPERHLFVRDVEISNFPDWPSSHNLSEMAQKWGPPRLAQTYVGAVDMMAGVRLLQYLETRDQATQLLTSQNFAPDLFEGQNTIFIGMPRTTTYLQDLLEKTNFYLANVEPDLVRNRRPKPGEAEEYKEASYSPDRRIAPAIIIFPPAKPQRTRTLVLMGRSPAVTTLMLLSEEGLRLLDEQWAKGGSPDAWELVIEGELDRGTALKVWPVAFRPLPSNFWQ